MEIYSRHSFIISRVQRLKGLFFSYTQPHFWSRRAFIIIGVKKSVRHASRVLLLLYLAIFHFWSGASYYTRRVQRVEKCVPNASNVISYLASYPHFGQGMLLFYQECSVFISFLSHLASLFFTAYFT